MWAQRYCACLGCMPDTVTRFLCTGLCWQAVACQIEARWRLNSRWGVVGFAGGGYIKDAILDFRDNTFIPSYGIGLRFMVLQAKRINLRVDYARSKDSDAFHVSVGEAF